MKTLVLSEQFIYTISGYSGTLSNIQPCSGTLRNIRAYSGIIEAYGTIIRHIRNTASSKKVPWFCKENPDFFDLWVKFSIQNVVLRVSRRKISKMSPCGVSFYCIFDMFLKCLSKYPSPRTPLPLFTKIYEYSGLWQI